MKYKKGRVIMIFHIITLNKKNVIYRDTNIKFKTIYNIHIFRKSNSEVYTPSIIGIIRVYNSNGLFLAEYQNKTENRHQILEYLLNNELFEIYSKDEETKEIILKMNSKLILSLVHEI